MAGAALYADRAFVSFQGVELINIQRAQLRQMFNSAAVKSMTPDGFNRGFVQGNREITIGLTLATEQTLARPKIELVDFKTQNYSITFEVGGNLWIVTGLFPLDTTDDTPGVGQEATYALNLGGTRIVDAVGNPAGVFDIALVG